MSRHFQVAKLLSGRDRRAFHARAANEVTTIDALRGWLKDRGYTVSRGAVHNYARHVRRGFLSDMRRQLSARSDAELRRKLTAWARQLAGAELVSVAFLAAFHADAKARREGRTKGN